ncbi:N-acetyltransferase [Filobacillus milosensis]|uniref:N-acetyltransferase n=1 Tax=Filobacillus milosensis TaxID=94137 RepID=A0A4Y8IQF9_9BACI|nr:GNAT family protein [Filobacillus milosensis]TFB22933.1 N-acetyltransferase [Filobacillus milosensis]
MTYEFQEMTQDQADEIAFNWHYDGDYSFYDMEADEEDLNEFINPYERKNYYAVIQNDDLIGFFSFNKQGEFIDIGLGMRPDLTGSGNGLEFLQAGMDFAKSTFNSSKFSLSVATFNQRAIKVYEKTGFKQVNTFMQETNGSTYEFVRMELNG